MRNLTICSLMLYWNRSEVVMMVFLCRCDMESVKSNVNIYHAEAANLARTYRPRPGSWENMWRMWPSCRWLEVLPVSKVQRSLKWRHNGGDGVSNHQPHDCLLNRLFYRDQRKHRSSASLAFVLGNSPVTSEFPAQMASTEENVSIWWRHHG